MTRIQLYRNTLPGGLPRNTTGDLIMILKEKFIVQQMDIKGAYLNGTLKERVYMHQSEGYEDGTN